MAQAAASLGEAWGKRKDLKGPNGKKKEEEMSKKRDSNHEGK